ncbi:MAG: N-glycosylase/DNA lyase [Candidatus Omnitrophica bacterium]|nr:N-glycosylase/DNA lyase [Candidatus Omnitrophota bacterium]
MTPPKSERKDLLSRYNKIKKSIKKRIGEFRRLHKKADEDIFGELCFCLMTANANALKCDEALTSLKRGNHHLKSCVRSIRSRIKGKVRFHNKKALFIVAARRLFKNGRKLDIKSKICTKDIVATRDWFVENIKGLGYKESSHFLRNIGLGRDIAILDRHILKNLKKYGVIEKIPDSVGSRKVYMGIEDKMRRFSKSVGIPLDELDLLFWSLQTGFIFK